MSSARFLPSTDEVRERVAATDMRAIDAQRVIMRDKLFAEVQDIRIRIAQGLPVEGSIADILETLIARVT